MNYHHEVHAKSWWRAPHSQAAMGRAVPVPSAAQPGPRRQHIRTSQRYRSPRPTALPVGLSAAPCHQEGLSAGCHGDPEPTEQTGLSGPRNAESRAAEDDKASSHPGNNMAGTVVTTCSRNSNRVFVSRVVFWKHLDLKESSGRQ